MTSITYTFSGNSDFQVPFPFISEAHLNVYLAGSTTASNQWTLVNGNTVQVTAPLVNGDTVFIERVTPISSALVDFTSNTSIRERELDTAFNQILFALQELDVEATAGLRKNGPGTAWDGENLPITSIISPTNPSDAATKGYVDTAILAGTGGLPTPSSSDIGLGLRIRDQNGTPEYQVSAVDGAVTSFKMTPGTQANVYARPVVRNSFGVAWVTEQSAEIPLTLESSHSTPQVGALSVSGNSVVIPPNGVFEVEATLRFRSKINGTGSQQISVDAGIVDGNSVVVDRTAGTGGQGLTTLGLPGGVLNRPIVEGPVTLLPNAFGVFEVMGQTINIVADTVFDTTTQAQIALNDLHQISGRREPDGSVTASYIKKVISLSNYRVVGVTENHSGHDLTIGGLNIDYLNADKSNLPGSNSFDTLTVEVKGAPSNFTTTQNPTTLNFDADYIGLPATSGTAADFRFPFIGTSTIKLYGIVSAGNANLPIYLRAVGDFNGLEEVMLDEGSRIVFRELT